MNWNMEIDMDLQATDTYTYRPVIGRWLRGPCRLAASGTYLPCSIELGTYLGACIGVYI